jgi:hypothetical protein
MMLHWSLFEAAQASGAHVLLDGHGGDDVISNGLPYLRELAARGRWRTFFAESRMLAQRFDLDLGRLVWQTGFRPLVPPWARRVRGLLSRRTLKRRTRRHEYSNGTRPVVPRWRSASLYVTGCNSVRNTQNSPKRRTRRSWRGARILRV